MRSFKLNFLQYRRNRLIAHLSGFLGLLLCCSFAINVQAQCPLSPEAAIPDAAYNNDGNPADAACVNVLYDPAVSGAATGISLDIAHTWQGDLTIFVIACGNTLNVMQEPGTGGCDFAGNSDDIGDPDVGPVVFETFTFDDGNLTDPEGGIGNTESGTGTAFGVTADDPCGTGTVASFAALAAACPAGPIDMQICVGDDAGGDNGFIQNVQIILPAAAVCGCIDPIAVNFNPAANVDDGSCTLGGVPANDLCADAEVLTPDGTTATGTTIGATSVVPPGFLPCGGVDSGLDGGVWYSVTAPADGDLQVDVSNTGPMVALDMAVYSGGCGGLTCIGGDSNLPPTFFFPATAGETFLIYVEDFDGFAIPGGFDIAVTFAVANDLCAGAEAIACGGIATGNTAFATANDAPADDFGCGDGTGLGTAPGLWYTWIGTGDLAIFSTCSAATDFDTKIGVFTDGCGVLNCIGRDDDDGACGFSTLSSSVSFLSVAGVEHHIYVTGFGANVGNFELSLTCVSPPPNDLCANALPIDCGGLVVGTTVNSSNADDPGACVNFTSGPGVWYSWTGTGDIATFSTCNAGTDYDSEIGIFSGACGALTCVAGENFNQNDAFCAGLPLFFGTEVTFNSVAGTDFFIYVSGFLDSDIGNFELSLTCTPIPPNDLCAGAEAIVCGGIATGNTVFATANDAPADDFGCGDGTVLGTAPGLWYTWIGTGDIATFSTCSAATNFDTKIGVFSDGCGVLNCIGRDDDDFTCPSSGLNSTVSFLSVAGVEHHIYVTGFGADVGTFELSLTCCPPIVINSVTAAPQSCPNLLDGSVIVDATGAAGAILEYSIDGFATSNITGAFLGLAASAVSVEVRYQGDAPCALTVTELDDPQLATTVDLINAAPCELTISDPCTCNDDATPIDLDNGTGGDDGTFSETVSIPVAPALLPEGLIFTVAPDDNFLTFTTGIDPAVIGTQLTFVEVIPAAGLVPAFGTYEVNFTHVDGIGYTMAIEGPFAPGSPLNPVPFQTISNRCDYPNPTFDGAFPVMDICATATAIPLGAMDTDGAAPEAPSPTFTINGNVVTEIDPAVLGAGTYQVNVSFDAVADANGGLSPDGGITPARPGCVQDAFQSVTIVAAPVIDMAATMATIDDESCDGANDGAITIIATGAGTFEYSIDNGGTFQASNVFMNLADGNYNIIVQNATPPAPPTCPSAVVPFTILQGANCGITITDPCNCNDDATIIDVDAGTGGDDGTFSETVTIDDNGAPSLPMGLTFSVVANDGGANVTTGVNDAGGAPVATDGSVMLTFVEDPANIGGGLGSYELVFTHVDAIGYTIVVEGPQVSGNAGNLFFSVSNNCSYPNPVFNPLLPTTAICANATPPIPLNAFDQIGMPFGVGFDFLGFTIAGGNLVGQVAVNEIDPTVLGPGTYTIVMTFDGDEDANGGLAPVGGTALPGCIQMVTQQITIIAAPTLQLPFVITDESCAGANDGSITATASGGGTFEFSIDGFATTNTTGVFTNVVPGAYTVSVRNTVAPDCVDTAPAVVAAGVACATITDPCVCLNNSSTIDSPANIGGTDGGFGELVSITGPAGAALPMGLVFTVGAPTNGVFDAFNVPAVGNPQNNVAIATDNSVALIRNPANGHYELPFVHIDGQGFNVTINGPGGLVFNSTNACAYPNPVFNPALPVADICPNGAPIALGATDPSGIAPDAVAFTINGAPAANINPVALGVGTHTVVMTFDGGADALGGIGGTPAAPAMPGCIQTVTQQITVGDAVDPVAVCAAPIFVDLDANGMGATTVAAVDGGSMDNCGIANITASPLDFDCDDIGDNNVMLTVTDINGNENTATCVVTVRDIIPAVILCRSPVNTINDPGDCGADILLLPPVVIDENCSIANVVRVPAAGFLFPTGTTTVTWTLTDAGGNPTACTQNVTINDTEDPVIDCPQSFVAYTSWDNCGYSASLIGTPTATDNCPGSGPGGTIVITPDAMNQNFYGPGQYMVGYTATDAAGNTATCMQWVTIIDATLPQVTSCPADIEVNATTSTGANVTWSTPTGVDNCTGPIILVEANGYASGGFFPLGDTEISYNLYDQNGQFAQCEFTVSVLPEGPLNFSMICMDDLDVSLQNAIGWSVLGWNPPLMGTNCEQCNILASDDFEFIGTLKGHQYYTHTAPTMTFAEAIAYAENVGAEIAVLEDRKEVPMVANEMPEGNYFIGLVDAEGTNEFAWINGDEFVHYNFGQNFENLSEEPAAVILNEDGEWEVVLMADATANFVFEKVCIELDMEIVEEADDIDPELAESGSTAEIKYIAIDPCGNVASCGFEVILVEETVAYCEPTGIASDDENPYFIESFSLNDYTVQSGDDNGYGDHTNENFLFEPGEVLSMERVFAGPDIEDVPMYSRIWMDLNNDGDFFDEGELVSQGVDIGEAVGTLTIPNINYSVENTVMRIAISRLTYPESCGDFLNGEVEDYTISIIQPEESQVSDNGSGLNTIGTNQVEADMLIYPNPAKDEMFVKLSNVEAEIATLRIFNSVGQLITNDKVATTSAVRLDVSDYTNGLYSITVEADGKVFLTQKFVIEK